MVSDKPGGLCVCSHSLPQENWQLSSCFLFGLKVMIIITLGHRQIDSGQSLSKVPNSALVSLEKKSEGQGKYMLIWSIFSQRKIH